MLNLLLAGFGYAIFGLNALAGLYILRWTVYPRPLPDWPRKRRRWRLRLNWALISRTALHVAILLAGALLLLKLLWWLDAHGFNNY